MKVVIFTYDEAPKERKDNVKLLKSQLEKMKSFEVEVFSGGTSTPENLRAMCELYQDQDIIMIEDDIKLSDTFEEDVTDFIQGYKNGSVKASDKIINFFWKTYPKRHTTYKGYNVYEVLGSRWSYNQCCYLPAYAVNLILSSYEKVCKTYPIHVKANHHASLMAMCFKRETFLVPELDVVTHLGFKSTIQN